MEQQHLRTLESEGYVVVPNALTEEQVSNAIDGVWKFVEKNSVGVVRDDETTWSNPFPYSMGLKGIVQQYSVAHEQFVWDVRQNPKVHDAFALIWKTEELLSSFDGICIQRPAEHLSGSKHSDRYGRNWWHVDQGRRKQGFRCVQGFVNLVDTTENDGCLVVLPRSHLLHSDFFEEFEDAPADDWVPLTEQQKRWYESKGCGPVRVVAPKGSLVLWDSRTVHANSTSQPDSFGNYPNKFRMVVYVCMTPRSLATAATINKRVRYFEERRVTSHWPHSVKVFPVYPNLRSPSDQKKYRPTIQRALENKPSPTLTELGRRLVGY